MRIIWSTGEIKNFNSLEMKMLENVDIDSQFRNNIGIYIPKDSNVYINVSDNNNTYLKCRISIDYKIDENTRMTYVYNVPHDIILLSVRQTKMNSIMNENTNAFKEDI